MADQFRDQVNTARRAGYSDDEIAGYLIGGNPNNKVKQALDEGYKPAEILQYFAPALSMGEEAVRKIRVGMRGVTESLAPSNELPKIAAGIIQGISNSFAQTLSNITHLVNIPRHN